jgi:hypothetical protein
MIPRYVPIAIGLISIIGVRPLLADGIEPSAAGTAEAFRAHAQETAKQYRIRGDRELKLRTEPVLRWTNPVQRGSHGEMFLWLDQGRPAVALTIYEFLNEERVLVEHHELSSLAPGKLVAEGPNKWAPAKAGVEWRPITNAGPPAVEARQRLREMRQLAERFTAEKTTRGGETTTLRLMPQPILRYESGPLDVIDGALFGFVEATDPEIALLIEAHGTRDELTWNYAIAPLTNVRLAVSFKNKPIWEQPLPNWKDVFQQPEKPYTIFRAN